MEKLDHIRRETIGRIALEQLNYINQKIDLEPSRSDKFGTLDPDTILLYQVRAQTLNVLATLGVTYADGVVVASLKPMPF